MFRTIEVLKAYDAQIDAVAFRYKFELEDGRKFISPVIVPPRGRDELEYILDDIKKAIRSQLIEV